MQHVGPTVHDELFDIILRCRQHPYVLSADIKQMYRQVKIKPDQRTFQRILWREDRTAPLRKYKLNTVTYGTSSAAFLATRCLRQIADENKETYPITSNTILHDFYVDDLLTGTKTFEAAVKIRNELEQLLSAAGMELHKWASNEPLILRERDSSRNEAVAIQGDKDPKTLGLWWDPSTDSLKYKVTNVERSKVTKRTILSMIV